MKLVRAGMLVVFTLLLMACDGKPLNDPYPKSAAKENTLYSSFSEQPKTLDPARAYSANESTFIAQIYEPPLQYHYLKRPFTLVPLSAKQPPQVIYLDKKMRTLPEDIAEKNIAYSRYIIDIKPGRYYQPHPGFAQDESGQYRYHHLSADYLDEHDIYSLADFTYNGTRELTAADFVYQIKRLAHPGLQSPILGLMSNQIVGLKDLAQQLQQEYEKITQQDEDHTYIDLRQYELEGVKATGPYQYYITIKGKDPQFSYWLAMTFFAPIPWEADVFYAQPDMLDRNISLDWYPVGTGPYQLVENNPNRHMVLKRNPNFSGETYPSEGSAEDKAKGLLVDAGKALPFIDQVIFNLEKESIPRWSKFLQGYYDTSGVSSDSFDQAIQVDAQGEAVLTPSMQKKGIKLYTSVNPAIYYMGFNMLDPVVGGQSERARKLRQAISIAVDYKEFISIFLNGRGLLAQGPIPPGIFGYQPGKAGMNPIVYQWKNDRLVRQLIEVAKRLLAEADYPNGRDSKTGKPLVLNYDVPISSGPDDKARFAWMRKQFDKLGIQLNIRATQYNRFQEKMRNGNAQIFFWGWLADYPDPENFLFLLYSKNGKVKYNGENTANYANTQYDRLFNKMKNMKNSEARLKIIRQMVSIVQRDAPWIWGFFPQQFTLSHHWNRVIKPSAIANNTLKYARLKPIERAEKRQAWNKPVFWPLVLVVIIILLGCIPVVIRYWYQEHHVRGSNKK